MNPSNFDLNFDLMNFLKEGLFAIIVLAMTIVLAPALRAFLRKFKDHPKWGFLGDLSRSASYLVYPLGFRIAADAAVLPPRIAFWVDSFIYLLFVLAFMNLFRQAAMIAVGWSAQKGPRNSQTFQQGFIPLLRNIVTLVVFLMGGIMALKHFGYDVMSLITALGVGSLAVGLAAKDTLSHMISGFTLIIDRNLRPGDKINLSGQVGIVEEIGLRSTRLNMRDGNILIVPNTDLVNTKILNMSMQGIAGATSTKFRVPLDVPFERVKAICEEIFPSVDKALPEKAGWVNLASVNEGHLLITTGFWVKDSDQAAAALTDFHIRLVARLRQDGVTLLPERTA